MRGRDFCYNSIIFVINSQRLFVINFVFILLTILLNSVCYAGPVNVRIESENNKNFHVGPEPRTRFELVEQYSPLATAKKVYQDSAPSRAFASSLSKTWKPIKPNINRQPIQLIVDFGKVGRDGIITTTLSSSPLPLIINEERANSQWLDWTKWEKCENGERIRTRKCIIVNNIPCEKGQNIERQKCYSTQTNSGLKFAQDPTIIEREIRGELANPR